MVLFLINRIPTIKKKKPKKETKQAKPQCWREKLQKWTDNTLSMWIVCRSIRDKQSCHVDSNWAYVCFILSLGLFLIKTNKEKQNKNTYLTEQKGSSTKFSSLSKFFISSSKLGKEVRSALYQKMGFSLAYKCMCTHWTEPRWYLVHHVTPGGFGRNC